MITPQQEYIILNQGHQMTQVMDRHKLNGKLYLDGTAVIIYFGLCLHPELVIFKKNGIFNGEIHKSQKELAKDLLNANSPKYYTKMIAELKVAALVVTKKNYVNLVSQPYSKGFGLTTPNFGGFIVVSRTQQMFDTYCKLSTTSRYLYPWMVLSSKYNVELNKYIIGTNKDLINKRVGMGKTSFYNSLKELETNGLIEISTLKIGTYNGLVMQLKTNKKGYVGL